MLLYNVFVQTLFLRRAKAHELLNTAKSNLPRLNFLRPVSIFLTSCALSFHSCQFLNDRREELNVCIEI